MLYNIFKPILFRLDPEKAHHFVLNVVKILDQLHLFNLFPEPSAIPIECFGLQFRNPIGLAPGMDVNAKALGAWEGLGFGFIELGGVTPQAQVGNPLPRLFRLQEDKAIINRMGFKNAGLESLTEKLKSVRSRCRIGVNIAKGRETPLEEAHIDYALCYSQLYPYVDYVTVNVSSPNTPGFRLMQGSEVLKSILTHLKQIQASESDKTGKKVPILVKIAPDLTRDELLGVIDQLVILGVEGVVATNTTISRNNLRNTKFSNETGGLSGAPLFEISNQMIKTIYQHVGDSLPIVAVGGVMNAQQAKAKLEKGAKLIQLLSGLVYRGPGLVREIVNELN